MSAVLCGHGLMASLSLMASTVLYMIGLYGGLYFWVADLTSMLDLMLLSAEIYGHSLIARFVRSRFEADMA